MATSADDILLNGTTFSSFGITPATGNYLNLAQTLIWKKIPMVRRHVKALTSNTGRIIFQNMYSTPVVSFAPERAQHLDRYAWVDRVFCVT
ncbi:hypothetical protein, partial [Pseudomonas syringae]|uniref:hypothetical protein n=1 Tax=Pseudomonas syringae TaxID=317 RepID=UPI001CA5E2A6